MSPRHHTLFALAVSFHLSPAVVAQVPPGWGVYSNLNVGSGQSTDAGLALFHPYDGTGLTPRPAAPFLRLTGALPPALTIPRSSPTLGGPNAVLVRDSDGSVVAATAIPAGFMMEIYHLKLNGSTNVVATATHTLGAPAGFGTIDQMAWWDEDRVLFCYRGLARPGWPSWGIGSLRLSTGVFTPINVQFTSASGNLNAMAVDRGKQTIYAGFFSPHELHAVGIGGGPSRRVATLPDGPLQLDVDHAGKVYVATFNSGLYICDPVTQVTTFMVRIPQPHGMTIDAVSGNVQLAQAATIWFPSWMFHYGLTLRGALLGVPGVDPLDSVTGIAIRSSLIPKGTGSPAYAWKVAPNPGGPPLVGNQRFALTVVTTARPMLGQVFLAPGLLGRPVRIGCGAWWLRGTMLGSSAMTIDPTRTEMSVGLPIPKSVALVGAVVFAQCWAADGCGLTSVQPLEVTLQ